MQGFIQNLAFEASAGSGKTFNLVVRYLSLLFMGVESKSILALTFTNKAANEMQERVIETLEHLEDRAELQVISDITSLTCNEILEQKEQILSKFLRSDIKIMTLDKFFAKILKKFALHVGLSPNMSTHESQHKIKLLITFLELVKKNKKEKSLIKLSLLMSKRFSDIFTLLNQFYQNERDIKALSFSASDLEPLRQEVLLHVKHLSEYVNKHKGASATAKKAFDVESVDELLTKTWLERDTLEYRTFSKCYEPIMDEYFHNLKAALKSYFEARDNQLFLEILELLALYKEAKISLAKENFELSFDDITLLTYQLLRNEIDGEFLYFRLDSKIEHMLLDEFQDTSIVQYEILKPIIDELVSGEGVHTHGSFFFVGDVKQSIYRFRGGVSGLFSHVVKTQGVELEKLKVNYRSSKEVVEYVNVIFESKIEGYTPQEAFSKSGGFIEVSQSDEILQTLLEKTQHLLSLGVKHDDIAILCATNGDGDSIEALLKEESIEVVTETSAKLMNQKNVKALREYLKYQYFGEKLYLENFFSLIAQEPFAVEKINFTKTNFVLHVKELVESYRLFDGDLNIFRFIEILNGYRDIEQFIYEHDRIGESAAKMDLHGVRVMTIHKSKGLEFEHVILLDRIKKRPASTASLIYDYNNITLESIYLRTKNRVTFDEKYKRAIEREDKLILQDRLNALYVAFTRAKNSLFVITKTEKSDFDILNLTLETRGILEVDESLHVRKEEEKVLVYKSEAYGLQKEILKVEDEASDDEVDKEAIEFGLALHYTLEMMKNFDEESLHVALKSTYLKYGYTLSSEKFEDLKRRIEMLCVNEHFKELTSAKVHKEQAITFEGSLKYLDVLVKHEEKYVVIDYKSSKKFAKHHVKQVSYYNYAINKITDVVTEGYICYILENEIELTRV